MLNNENNGEIMRFEIDENSHVNRDTDRVSKATWLGKTYEIKSPVVNSIFAFFVGFVFFIVGLVIIYFGTMETSGIKNEKIYYTETQAEVTSRTIFHGESGWRYSYSYEYSVDGVEYTASQDYIKKLYNKGDHVKNYYKTNDPEIYLFPEKDINISLIIVGSFSLLVGVLLFILTIINAIQNKKYGIKDCSKQSISEAKRDYELKKFRESNFASKPEENKCPYCKAINSGNVTHCNKCGARLK